MSPELVTAASLVGLVIGILLSITVFATKIDPADIKAKVRARKTKTKKKVTSRK